MVLGGNPAFNAPADLRFADALTDLSRAKTAFTAHLGLYRDETARLCQWHVPEAHFLESWSDARVYDGTVSIVQPLLAPLYRGVSAHQVLAVLQGRPSASAHDLVREFWREQWKGRGGAGAFEQFWEKALHDGVVEGTAFSPRAVTLRENWWKDGVREEARLAPSASEESSLEIVFRPDPTIYDGRFANNGWLQELPKPLTKLTWDAVALVSPRTAKERGLAHEIGAEGGSVHTDLVELEYQGRKLEAPVWIVPGHAEGAVTVYFGYGRTHVPRFALASRDRFFLCVEARDPRFDRQATREFLAGLGPRAVWEVPP